MIANDPAPGTSGTTRAPQAVIEVADAVAVALEEEEVGEVVGGQITKKSW